MNACSSYREPSVLGSQDRRAALRSQGMTNETLNDLCTRAVHALNQQHATAVAELTRTYNALREELVAQTEALYELEPSTLDMLERAHAVWIGEITIPKEPVRAAIELALDGGTVRMNIGPSLWQTRDLLPTLAPGKFRIVCFALRTGNVELCTCTADEPSAGNWHASSCPMFRKANV